MYKYIEQSNYDMARIMCIDEFSKTNLKAAGVNEKYEYDPECYSDALNRFLKEKITDAGFAKSKFKETYPYLYGDMETFVDALMSQGLTTREMLYDRISEFGNNEIFDNDRKTAEKKIEAYSFDIFDLLENRGEWDRDDEFIIMDYESKQVMSFDEDCHVLNIKAFVEWVVYDYCKPCKDFESFLSSLQLRINENREYNRSYTKYYYTDETFGILYGIYAKWCEVNGYDMVNEAKYNVNYACGHSDTV